jgi:hypothetical protein
MTAPEPTGEQVVTHDGFLTNEQYQRSPELRRRWEESGMRSFTTYIAEHGLTVIDSPVGKWIEEHDPEHPLGHHWRYRVQAHVHRP